MDFVSAVQAVMNQAPAVRITPPPKHEKPTQPALPRYTFDCKTVKDYLQERGIDGEIIDNFIEQKQIAESVKTGAALFFGKDKAGNVRQCSERATDGTPNKKDTYGSDRSYCFFSEARVGMREGILIAKCQKCKAVTPLNLAYFYTSKTYKRPSAFLPERGF